MNANDSNNLNASWWRKKQIAEKLRGERVGDNSDLIASVAVLEER